MVSRELLAAHIPCALMDGPLNEGTFPSACYTELWIQNDQDYHRALMLCVELGVGFAKRPPQPELVQPADEDG